MLKPIAKENTPTTTQHIMVTSMVVYINFSFRGTNQFNSSRHLFIIKVIRLALFEKYHNLLIIQTP